MLKAHKPLQKNKLIRLRTIRTLLLNEERKIKDKCWKSHAPDMHCDCRAKVNLLHDLQQKTFNPSYNIKKEPK